MKRIKRFTGVFLIGSIMGGWRAFSQAKEPVLSDRQITHHVHSAIVEDKSLPYCAHIVNVQAKEGKVTLKGRVHTEEQKQHIENKAAGVVGTDDVINNIVVRDPASD